MNFLQDIPNISVIINDSPILNIDTVTFYKEDEKTITMSCAEYIPQFKRGFTCDMKLEFSRTNNNQVRQLNIHDDIKNLVLVYINKDAQLGNIIDIKYIFYK